MAAAGAAGAFVAGISAQAVRGHGTPAGAETSSAAVRAAISDTSTVRPPSGAPSLRAVALPGLRAAPKPPKPRKAPPAAPHPSALVAATSPPAATPVPTPARVVAAPPAPAPAVKAPSKPSTPARGPGFDSSG
jgi:hypothetical protein